MGITCLSLTRFYLLVSFFIIPISVLWKGPSLVMIGDVSVITVVIGILLGRRLRKDLIWFIPPMALTLGGMLLVFRHSDIVVFLHSRSLFTSTVYMFFFSYTFSKLNNDGLKRMDLFIQKVIKIAITAIVLDGVAINFFGMYHQFGEIFQGSLGEYYAQANHGPFFKHTPNGLTFGAQNAAILSVVGIFWWLPWNRWRDIGARQLFWLAVSIVSFAFTMTTTAIFSLVAPLAFVSFFRLSRKHKLISGIFILALPFLFISFYKQIYAIRYHLEYNVDEIDAKMERYYKSSIEMPMENIKKNLENMLPGVGHQQAVQISIGEVGFITTAYQYGLVLLIILILYYLVHLFKIVKFIRKRSVMENEKIIILKTTIVGLSIFLSLLHYKTILISGVKQLFVAVVVLSYMMMKNCQKNAPVTVLKKPCPTTNRSSED